ncbi:polysaccharide lyase 8 family protein [Amycolatopsis acidiphila]|uniref:Polysaccharide lyase 8 family protein n=1 Tax=Amycolatopsis acidiphila TaxID=715473 RepID=A0A558A2X4_9PSEU|nr:polysaccharide lyase 8 family protein [Amycolatopsis acidiphila]TVT18598.1 polysaccharide lyase 8 family protein [Amycolatopsis acidiphila]UIJ56575.1 polysaccharide lyase 8 family protein [Amycolatopsis acidiphila]GHG66582.1 hyaluronate lyase [Amycolatopsis acidiphila]
MISRRTVLRAGALAPVVLGAVGTRPAFAAAPAPTAAVVAAYRELQTGTDRASPERTAALANLGRVAKSYHDSMSVTAGGPLWTDLPFGPGSDYTTSMYGRLRAIAVDWGTPGGTLAGDAGVLDRVKKALDLLYTVQYNENVAELGNWYTYEIGVPYYLLHTLVTVAGELDAADLARYVRPVARFVGDPNRRANSPSTVETGANRADKALISIVSGALTGDTGWIRTGIDAITDVAGGGADSVLAKLDRAAGDGFHTDGSFIQHETVPYPGHYGIVLLTALAGAVHVTEGTSFALPADVKDQVCALVSDTFAPFVVGGALMEPVRGRMLSRQGETGHDIGHQLTVAAAVLAQTAPEPAKTVLGGLVAKWIGEGTYAPFLQIPDPERFAPGPDLVAVPGIELAQELLATGVRPAPTVATHRIFGQQDRMVHVTRDWSASLGVGSTRIARYESINSMNLHGWYTGDGVLYTFLANARGHYSDAYWPTVDPLLLPGTTAKSGDPGPLAATPLTTRAHTGGVRHDDGHGAYALDFVSADGTLTAKKSWFCTPAGIVCLGAGITDDSGERVRTTIENRNLGERGDPVLLADGRRAGPSGTLRSRWLHLQDVGGYLVLDGARVTALREDRTGAWRDVDTGANTKGTTVPCTRRYQKLILDHGVRPSGASYAYAVLPTASVVETAAAVLAWRVLANTPAVQAIQLSDGTLLANFFAAGALGGVRVSGPASVALGRVGGAWQLAVTDPTQLQDTVRVTARGQAVSVPVSGAFGATRTVRLGRS